MGQEFQTASTEQLLLGGLSHGSNWFQYLKTWQCPRWLCWQILDDGWEFSCGYWPRCLHIDSSMIFVWLDFFYGSRVRVTGLCWSFNLPFFNVNPTVLYKEWDMDKLIPTIISFEEFPSNVNFTVLYKIWAMDEVFPQSSFLYYQ